MRTAISAFGAVVLCSLLCGGCNTEKKPMAAAAQASSAASTTAAPVKLPGTQWTLEEIGGKAVIANSHATLTFPETGKTAGNGSCNRFTGSVEIDGSTIKFGPLAATRMMCEGEVSQQESEYLKALEAVRRFEVKEGKLGLFGDHPEKLLQFAETGAAK